MLQKNLKILEGRGVLYLVLSYLEAPQKVAKKIEVNHLFVSLEWNW